MKPLIDSEKAIRNLKKVSDMRNFYHELAKGRFQDSSFQNAAMTYLKRLKNEINEFVRINKLT